MCTMVRRERNLLALSLALAGLAPARPEGALQQRNRSLL